MFRYPAHPSYVTTMGVSDTNKHVCSGSSDAILYVLSAEKSETAIDNNEQIVILDPKRE